MDRSFIKVIKRVKYTLKSYNCEHLTTRIIINLNDNLDSPTIPSIKLTVE